MRGFEFIALTPAGLVDPSIAIAASRAGAWGILNLEATNDIPSAQMAMATLARYTDQTFGIKFDSGASAMIDALIGAGDLPHNLRVIILTPWHAENLRQQLPVLRHRGLKVLLEVTNVEQADLARQLGADGLIAKGHEAGGWVGEETTFILLQRLLSTFELPVWAFGGIGLHTAAACYAAGAAGVVLDSQLALARESRLPGVVQAAIAAMDGSETLCLGSELGHSFRTYNRPDAVAVQALNEAAIGLAQDDPSGEQRVQVWRQTVAARIGWGSLEENVWPLGQDATFAESLARRYRTVGGILGAMRDALEADVQAASRLRPLDENSPLAQDHNIRYPIVQGPMTRVSDRAEFALRVAEGGGLPFLALALMRAPEVDALLAETKQLMGDRPWGVGILGFVPLALRQEQLEVIRKYSPPYALIAGGRPDQALALEQEGIPTYLHVPSPGLLRLFLQDGARRFVFEGRECGGHVGPRSSFVLWNTMVDVLLEELSGGDASDCYVLFAGGVHDRRSAAMVAAIAAPLAERGMRIGVLMGTAYLFSEEAVAAGGILPGFQEEALRCQGTVLLESGPGHATRCVPTPYVDAFEQEKLRLRQAGKSAEEMRHALEQLNVGRLRVASKGITRHPRHKQDPEAPKYVAVSEEEQRRQGLYMIGQVAALRDRTCTIADLHHEVAVESTRLLKASNASSSISKFPSLAKPSQIAIVGMSTLLPKANNLREFWANVMNRVDAITEVPKERWDSGLYYDPDRNAKDKIYSKSGGFLDDIPFNPVEFGIPPNSLPSIDPLHLLALIAARDALADAGYADRPFDRSRTSVILGASGGTGDLGASYLLRSGLPMLFGEHGFQIAEEAGDSLPEWTEDSFAGLLLNVAAGRIANRLDFGGLNYVVDAACASSLAALHLAVKELETHNTDLVITGGVDTVQNPFGYLCFSKTQALSLSGEPRVFDATADGIVISEGVVMLVLKRLADAERDGDRIYAVISAVAGSSDGRGMGMMAPRPEGQTLAYQRAYAKAGFSPTTVGLFEAHGTGTVVGDRAEAASLSSFLQAQGAKPRRHALGSIKSMIGHTKATAGVAGVAKVACALYHKVLPPTLRVTQPNPKAGFGNGPLYINSETRPWIQGVHDHPRRAGVSAFGFGGTNFHAVLEEYRGDFLAEQREAVQQSWPSELLLWTGSSRQELVVSLEDLEQAINQGAKPSLRDLAYTLGQIASKQFTADDLRLAIVAESLEDLRQKLTSAREKLKGGNPAQVWDLRGVYFSPEPLARAGKVAFLFPGQGSQYPNMLRDLTIHIAQVRETFEEVESVLAHNFPEPLSSYIFPPPAFTPEEERAQKKTLTRTNVAQPALGAADMAVSKLLRALGVQPGLVAGHSSGEYAALCAADVIDQETLAVLSEARGRSIIEAAKDELGTMAAVRAGVDSIAPILQSLSDVWIANLNAPSQTIISGTQDGIAAAVQHLLSHNISARSIPVACAFHSPLVEPAKERLMGVLSQASFASPSVEVFSNTTAAPYPHQPEAICEILGEHLVRPVRFADQIGAMYEAGARVFVEAGPGSVLTNLVGQILTDRSHVSVAVDLPGRNGLTQLQHVLGQLATHGVDVELGLLFKGREARLLDLNALAEETQERPRPATTWLVNGGRARPLNAPEAISRPPQSLAELIDQASVSDQATQAQAPSTSTPTVSLSPTSSTPVAGTQAGDEAEQVMLQFQQSMALFLETQRNVMLTYLQTAAGEVTQRDGVPRTITALPPAAPSSLPETSREETSHASSPEVPELESVPTTVGSDGRDAPPVAEPATYTVPDKEQLTQSLLEIVSQRTGYPTEMLDLDVDIEANLGIDSIKRVEILGILQRDHIPPDYQVPSGAMEQLTGIRTLRGVIDWLDNALHDGVLDGQDQTIAEPPEAGTAQRSDELASQAANDEQNVDILRSRLAAVNAPLSSVQSVRFQPEHIILITDDGGGVASAVAERIRQQGGQAILIGLGAGSQTNDDEALQVDLSDPAAVSGLVASLREQGGAIGGILHLLPLQDEFDLETIDLAGWRDHLRRQVKSLFYLVSAAAGDLRQARETGRAWVMAATRLGGAESNQASPVQERFAGQAGLAGLIKTLALEWPAVECKVVNLDPISPPPILAEQVYGEMASADGLVEVRYQGTQRQRLRPILAPLNEDEPAQLAIDEDWVLLVTGGARGITAEIACELAERYQPTHVLVGSSPLPASEEASYTAGLESPQELKVALMEHMRQTGEQVKLDQVERAYKRLLKEREIRRNLARMRRAGARVHYYQVDVREKQAMARLIEEVYQQHGRLDGVIHGAGIIEDKLVEDKTPDSFDRVFDTKADSVFMLSRLLRPESLKFLALFSSAAGLFGNRGQIDYAAANEVLNKLATHLDQRWPGRVVSINWGPWLKTGMVSLELQRQFARRNIQLISIPIGCRLFDRELRYGRKGEAEIILAGGTWSDGAAFGSSDPTVAQGDSVASHPFPLLQQATVSTGAGDGVEVVRSLDPSVDLYLQDHKLDGKPVFPVAMAMELMAEVVQHGWPNKEVVGLRDLKVLKGIVVEHGPRKMRVSARAAKNLPPDQSGTPISVEIVDEESGRLHYQAVVELADVLSPPAYQTPILKDLRPFSMNVEEAYRRWLFHGPLFQGIKDIQGMSDHLMVATCLPSSPQQCLANSLGGEWLIDPVVFDSGLQLIILWTRAHLDTTPLPARFSRYRRFGSLSRAKVQCFLQVPDRPDGQTFSVDIAFVDSDGRLLGLLEGMECPSSKAFNRLAGTHLAS